MISKESMKEYPKQILSKSLRGVAIATVASGMAAGIALAVPSGNPIVVPPTKFAAGYSACFLGAMKFVPARHKIALPADVSIEGSVEIGAIPNGFGIEVDLKISLPSMAPEAARALIDKAHIVCRYSSATRNNIDVRLTLCA
jgi:Ohr subfamily peroxiredoxin